VKLGSVASDILGVTGRRIIEAIVAGQEHPDCLADKACGTLRPKRDQLRLVLKGRITDHHRYMLRELMADRDRIEAKILRLENEIADRMKPYASAIERLMTIPGLRLITAWSIIAEMGTDMSAFPTKWPDKQGEPLAAPRSSAVGMGRVAQEQLLSDRPVLSARLSPGREESHQRHRASIARRRVLHSARRDGLRREGRQLLRPNQSGTNQTEAHGATGADGIRRYSAKLDSPCSVAIRTTTFSSAAWPPL
jgi:transposase